MKKKVRFERTPTQQEITNPVCFLWSERGVPREHVHALGQNPRERAQEEVMRQEGEQIAEWLQTAKQ